MAQFTRAQFKASLNSALKNKTGMLTDYDDSINRVVRNVISEVKLRSQKRKSRLAPNLFSDIYTYSAPVDLDEQAISGISPQVDREGWSDWGLVTVEEFDIKKSVSDRLVAVDDHDDIKKLLISKDINDNTMSISSLDSITSGGGTWEVVGGATNLVADSSDYIKGSGCLVYDIDATSTTTAGIRNTGLDVFDFTEYQSSSIFHWVYIQNTTGITSYTLKVGSSTANYYTKTVTSTNEGTSFVTGWNLLRFDMANATVVGTPVLTTFNYVEIYMNKLTSKVSETGYRADYLEAKIGKIYDLYYYSDYGWQNSSGTWIEESTDDSDILNASNGEYELFIQKGVEIIGPDVEEDKRADIAARKFQQLKDDYEMANPDDSLILQIEYYTFN